MTFDSWCVIEVLESASPPHMSSVHRKGWFMLEKKFVNGRVMFVSIEGSCNVSRKIIGVEKTTRKE